MGFYKLGTRESKVQREQSNILETIKQLQCLVGFINKRTVNLNLGKIRVTSSLRWVKDEKELVESLTSLQQNKELHLSTVTD